MLYAHSKSKTVLETMNAAKNIVRDLHGISVAWVQNLYELYSEIIDTEEEGSHLMSAW